MPSKGLYIHIPFCVKKCNYCAFLSFNADDKTKQDYVKALINEIKLKSVGRPSVETIYIGGGTPSVLKVSQMRDILQTVFECLDVKPDAEITIEVNPGTLGSSDESILSKLKAYREMGFNRLSMGVQSTDNNRLHFLGRIHSAEEVERDVRLAGKAGFDNINLDLIFSVPGESKADALLDARQLIKLKPEHISCYSLQMEEGTPFYEMADNGDIIEVSDEEDRETYHEICRLLKGAGYEHYEISNFAKPGFRSRHNSLYWDMSEYIGCGLGAAGFEGGVRYKNVSDIEEYLRAYSDEDSLPNKPLFDEENVNTPFDNISEAVFTGLRRKEGISYKEVCKSEQEFWTVFADARQEAEKFAESGYLIIDRRGLRLTEKGIDISNQIMSLFV